MAEDTLKEKIANVIRQWEGPLTRELLLKPGSFGLGKIPEKLSPDSTTNVVCGYCSTGCGLNVHLKDGEAINLSPSTDYPVNLGMACPKGWESLTLMNADDRATTPYLRSAHGKLHPVSWHEAMVEFTNNFKSIQEKYGNESVAFGLNNTASGNESGALSGQNNMATNTEADNRIGISAAARSSGKTPDATIRLRFVGCPGELVELTGFEPATSWLQTRRSPS